MLVAVTVAVLAGAAPSSAVLVTTTVDPVARSVTINFVDLPPYEQIHLDGVLALDACQCNDPRNPSSKELTGSSWGAGRLEMEYKRVAPPPAANFILYHYLDGYVFDGFEQAEWLQVTPRNGDGFMLTGDRPVFVPVPEVSTALLIGVGLAMVGARVRFSNPARTSAKGLRHVPLDPPS